MCWTQPLLCLRKSHSWFLFFPFSHLLGFFLRYHESLEVYLWAHNCHFVLSTSGFILQTIFNWTVILFIEQIKGLNIREAKQLAPNHGCGIWIHICWSLVGGEIRERTVSRILFMRLKRKPTAFLASVPFVEMCMCGTHCFLKSFDIYQSIIVSPKHLVEEETGLP